MTFDSMEAGVRTVCRFRPPNKREIQLGFEESNNGIQIRKPGTVFIEMPTNKQGKATTERKTFVVNHVFGMDSCQREVYDVVAAPSVRDIFNGFNGTVFAFGQTGAGKSFTMFGSLGDETTKGVIPRSIEAIFARIAEEETNTEYTISCSYLEVYREELRDLLAAEKKKLEIRQKPDRGIYVENLHHEYVSSESDIYDCLHVGNEQRKVGRTNMNNVSSRSHCVFTVHLQQIGADGVTKMAKLNLVDLAGSEKVRKSGATGETLEEAKKINLSLTCLSQCIYALSSGKQSHVPYRTSKLTRLLQESLGGNSKTTLMIACSPSVDNIDETIATLRFAERCAAVKNAVRQNVHLSVEQLTEMVNSLTLELASVKKYSLAMEAKLKGMGVSLTGLGQALSESKEASMQFPEGSRLSSTDLKAAPWRGEFGTPRRRSKNFNNLRKAFEQQQQELENGGENNNNNNNGGRLSERDILGQANLAWVAAKVVFVGATADQFPLESRNIFIGVIHNYVREIGVGRDDIFVSDVKEEDGSLIVSPVVVCDSPMATEIVQVLRTQISSGDLLRALHAAGLLITTEELKVEQVEEKKPDALVETRLTSSQDVVVGNILEGMVAEAMISSAPSFARSNTARNTEIEDLSRQLVEDQAEIEALRNELSNLRQENREVSTQLNLKQLEVDSTKERLVVANTKLLKVAHKFKQQSQDKMQAQLRQTDISAAHSPQLAKKKPQHVNRGIAFTSREPEEEEEIEKRSLFRKLNKSQIMKKKIQRSPTPQSRMSSLGIAVMADPSSEEEGKDTVAELQTGSMESTSSFFKPANLSVRSPSLELSLSGLSGISEDNNEELAAPRRREDEELDDLLKKQEELSKTVRRQQSLVERQADALQQVGARAQTAEKEVSFLQQERDFLQDRVQKLELKLYKHGLTQRRPSLSLGNKGGLERQESAGPNTTRASLLQNTGRTVQNGYETFRTTSGKGLNLSNISGMERQSSGIQTGDRHVLPSQRDKQGAAAGMVLPSVREGAHIRKPVRTQSNSAVERARQDTNNSFVSDMFKPAQFLSKLFNEEDENSSSILSPGDREAQIIEAETLSNRGDSSARELKKARSFFGF